MIAVDLLDEIAAAVGGVLALPPPPRPLLDFARTLRYPDGPAEGQQCDPESHVATYEILRAFAAGGFDEIVTLGPVQDTKTWSTTTVPALFALVELRSSVVIGWPDRSLCAKYWRQKLKPTIDASELAHLLPLDGPGSDGGAPEDVLFTTGARLNLMGAGARNEAGQSMVTAPIVLVEERDSIRPRWVQLLFMRCASYGERQRRHSTSTIKHDKGSTTLETFEQGLAMRPWFRCPLCVTAEHASGGWQIFDPERFAYDPTDDITAEQTAHIVCAHVSEHRITEALRIEAITGRRWVLAARGQKVLPDGSVDGEAPRTRIWSFRWTALDSPLKPLGQLAKRHRQACELRDAHGDHAEIRQFYRDMWATPYREEVEGQDNAAVVSPIYLQARSKLHGWDPAVADRDELGRYSRHVAPIPDQAQFASLTIDVQQNRLYWKLDAADLDMRTWDMAWGYEFASASQDPLSDVELHGLFDRIHGFAADLVTNAERSIPIVARGIDVGYNQSAIVDWLSGHPEWIPLSGAGDDVAGKLRATNAAGDLLGVLYRRRPEGWRLGGRQLLHLIDVDKVKEMAQSAFLRPAGAPGAAHLPQGLKSNDSLIKHLTGEILEEDDRTGRRKWVVKNKRHDFLDLRTYNVALLRLHVRNTTRTSPRRNFGVVGNIGA